MGKTRATEVTQEVKAEVTSKPKATEVTVTWRGGSRVYSEKVHGENFVELAKEFATKFDGVVA